MAQQHSTSTDMIDDLVVSFSKLLHNASGDSDTLFKFQAMISDEIEKASNAGSLSDSRSSDVDLFASTTNPQDENTIVEEKKIEDVLPLISDEPPAQPKESNELGNLISHIPSILTQEYLDELKLEDELHEMYSEETSKCKYIWMSNPLIPYKFGGKTYTSHDIQGRAGVRNLMDRINKEHHLELDSCLIVRYLTGDQALNLHQDNEPILDGSHPIVLTSVGCPRTIQFWDSYAESSGNLVDEVIVRQGDLLLMNPGCQNKLWHKVLPMLAPSSAGLRYALSFRKMKSIFPDPYTHQTTDYGLNTSTPISKPLIALENGFMVHPERREQTIVNEKAIPSTIQTKVPVQNLTSNRMNAPQPSYPKPSPKHLIIGDSMVNGLRVHGSVCIFKGGICPNEVLRLLPGCMDILHPNNYVEIRSVTLVVGTNALNVNSPNKGMPLLDVVFDYEKLVHELMQLFPNARIGLYNVLPRAYTCQETRARIEMFNTTFNEHVAPRLKNVVWIRHYCEFLDQWGNLRYDLYGKRGLHLKPKGKAMMTRTIKNFQHAYN